MIGIPVLLMSLAEMFRNQNFDWLIEQFLPGVAKHAFRLRVDQQHPPGAIHNDHGIGRCFQQTAEFFVPVAHAFIVVGSSLPHGGNLALCRARRKAIRTHHSARHGLARDTGQEQIARTAWPSGSPQSRPDRHPQTEVIFKHVSSGAAITQPKMSYAAAGSADA